MVESIILDIVLFGQFPSVFEILGSLLILSGVGLTVLKDDNKKIARLSATSSHLAHQVTTK